MRRRSIWRILMVGIGLSVAVAAMVGVERLLPPVVPEPQPVAVAALHSHPRSAPSVVHHTGPHSTAPKPNASGLVPITYGQALVNIGQLGREMGLSVWVPRLGVPPVAFQEAYREGDQLDLLYSNMIIIESMKALQPSFRPVSTVGTALTNGAPAEWDWIPGVGGPTHRLMFKQGRTYIRLEMEHVSSKNPIQTAVAVASTFMRPTSLG